jgi:hypothetical protein
MGFPQVVVIVLYSLSLGMSFMQHGKPKTGKYDAWGTLFATIIMILILNWGGFFK